MSTLTRVLIVLMLVIASGEIILKKLDTNGKRSLVKVAESLVDKREDV